MILNQRNVMNVFLNNDESETFNVNKNHFYSHEVDMN